MLNETLMGATIFATAVPARQAVPTRRGPGVGRPGMTEGADG